MYSIPELINVPGSQMHEVFFDTNFTLAPSVSRLILIAERKTVYEKFPTPLINRLEKHFVLTSSVLLDWQLEVLQEFEEWIRQFSFVG